MITVPSPPPIVSWSSFFFIVPLLIVLFPFWLIVKLCAKQAQKLTGKKPVRWLFLVAVLFLGVVLYLTVSDLIKISLRYFLSDLGRSVYSYDQLIRGISARMVIILLGFPLLAGVWYKATEEFREETQEKSESLTRKYVLNFEVLVFVIILILCFGTCLYYFFNWVLGVSEIEWNSFFIPLSYGSTALIFFVSKLRSLLQIKKN